jgi:twitching motility two-component system response regulator PilH
MPAHLALIVEPDDGTREVFGGVLTAVAFEIEYADDGRDALAKAIGHQPGVVVTATRLAFIDGYVLCSLLRSDQLTARAAIVIVTDDSNAGGIARARSSGADSVLIKPVLPQALLQAVERRHSGPPKASLCAGAPGRRSDAPALELRASEISLAERSTRPLVCVHQRFETAAPAKVPPLLRCPSCDQTLQYVGSHIGGVSARRSEQWDYYACAKACGPFQYRHRTRRLRRVEQVDCPCGVAQFSQKACSRS